MLAGLVTTLIAIQLFRDFARTTRRSRAPPRGGRHRRALLERSQADFGNATGAVAPGADVRTARALEHATGDKIYFDGPVRARSRAVEAADPRLKRLSTNDRLDLRQDADVRVHAAGRAPGAYYAVANPIVLGRRERRTIGAIVVAKPKTDVSKRRRLAARAARGGRASRPPRRRRRSRWYVSRRIVRPVLQLSDAADEVAAGDYDVDVPANAPGEIGHLPSGSTRWPHGWRRSRRMERNFLMSVSHELRTPLTAIRGHVSALLEGVVRGSGARARLARDVEAEAQRLERLVGDILDLAQARHAPLHGPRARRSTWSSSSSRRTSVQRGGAAPLDRLPAGDRARPVIVSDGDRVLQIVDNLLSNAFRATPDGGRDRARARADERHGARDGRGHRAGHPAGDAGAALPARSSRRAAAGPVSASRSRRSSRRARRDGSSSTPRSGAARASSSSCPRLGRAS